MIFMLENVINNIAHPNGICLEKYLFEKFLCRKKINERKTGNKQAFEDILIYQLDWMTLEQASPPYLGVERV